MYVLVVVLAVGCFAAGVVVGAVVVVGGGCGVFGGGGTCRGPEARLIILEIILSHFGSSHRLRKFSSYTQDNPWKTKTTIPQWTLFAVLFPSTQQ